jgi:hypothetical protein
MDHVESLLTSMETILVTEYFDESLMLLRRKLGWHMIDMTYLKAEHQPVWCLVDTRARRPMTLTRPFR